jgi:hypothetical protein
VSGELLPVVPVELPVELPLPFVVFEGVPLDEPQFPLVPLPFPAGVPEVLGESAPLPAVPVLPLLLVPVVAPGSGAPPVLVPMLPGWLPVCDPVPMLPGWLPVCDPVCDPVLLPLCAPAPAPVPPAEPAPAAPPAWAKAMVPSASESVAINRILRIVHVSLCAVLQRRFPIFEVATVRMAHKPQALGDG